MNTKNLAMEEMKKTAISVNSSIFHYLEPLKEENSSLYQIASYLPRLRISNSQPTLRPFLVRLGYEITGGKDYLDILPIMAAVELLNMSTYVIDDIFDNCPLRQGKKAVHEKYGEANAVITGMLLREIAEENLHSVTIPENKLKQILKLFVETHKTIYIGQYLDLDINNKKITEEEYIKRSYLITGAFIKNCLLLGMYVNTVDDNTFSAIETFGKNYGIALQIRNDLMDFILSKQIIYKDKIPSSSLKGVSHVDVKEGKPVLPIIHALESSSKFEEQIIKKVLGNQKATPSDLLELNKILKNLGSFEYTIKKVDEYRKKAINALFSVSDSKTKTILLGLTQLIDNIYSWKFTF
ncbi:MAG: polyprenyl synthetase family protein [Candidatus Micrarchaeia archaeon]|jgi:geranylgeranyl pyrophosphate synthase